MSERDSESNGNNKKIGRRDRRPKKSPNEISKTHRGGSSYVFKSDIFISSGELNVFRLMDPANLSSYAQLKSAYQDRTFKWIRTNPAELFAILGHTNIRSVYNILHRFRKRGIFEVQFQRAKGILIKFSLVESHIQESIKHQLVLLPGDSVFIQTEGARCI